MADEQIIQNQDPVIQRRKNLLLEVLNNFRKGFASGESLTTRSQAESLGLPQAAGLTESQTRLLADMPLRQARIDAAKSKANINSLILRSSQGDDKMNLETLKELDRQLSGVNGMLLQSSDPMHFQFATSWRENLSKKLAGKKGVSPKPGLDPTTQPDKPLGPQKFRSADEVRQSFKSGKLTRDQAKKILGSQFGIK